MASRRSCWLALLAGALASGCVERRMVINTAPPGTKVYVNDEPVGFTPVDVWYDYYGTYNITLERDGFQTQTVRQRLAPPWYAYPPFDFVAENLWPWTLRDIRRLDYDLAPLPQPGIDELKQNADALRERGQTLPEPSVSTPPPDQRR